MVIGQKDGREKLLADLRREFRGRGHFEERVDSERVETLSARQLRRAIYCYHMLKAGKHQQFKKDGRYAIQFGGIPRDRGNYLIVAVMHGRVNTFLTILVDQLEAGRVSCTAPRRLASEIGIDLNKVGEFFEGRELKRGGSIARRKKLFLTWLTIEFGASQELMFKKFGMTHTRRALGELVKDGMLKHDQGFYYLASLEEE